MKIYLPTTPSRRGMIGRTASVLTKKSPERFLLAPRVSKAGRGYKGRITVRHRGGGNKTKLRLVDFKRRKFNVPAAVAAMEYDPTRTAYLALLHYADGEKSYIIAPEGLKIGDTVMSGEKIDFKIGNAMKLKNIPVGTEVSLAELQPGRGAQIIRSAGSRAEVLAQDGSYTHLRFPSSEVRKVLSECLATIGQVSNAEHFNVKFGKAGRSRWVGRRPQVRGSAMNPVDHPHGGGEGRSPIGRPGPRTPWGKPALGLRTRKKNKRSHVFIVTRRKNKKKR